MYLKVLIVEDSEDDAILLANYLKSCGFDPKWQRVDCEADLAEAVEDRRWDLVLCDLSMPKLTPVMAVNCVRQVNPDIPIIIVTGAVAEDVAISLIQHGVQDVVLKDDLPRLKTAFRREQIVAQNRREKAAAELRLAAAIEYLYQGVALFDAESRLITCNQRYKTTIDCCQHLIEPGVSYADILRAAMDRGQFKISQHGKDNTLQRLLAYHITDGGPFVQEHHDGRWIEIQRHGTLDGGIVTVTTDVTESKQREEALIRKSAELAKINQDLVQEIARREAIEEALKESESRARATFESAVDGVITFNDNYRVETVNPAAERIFEYGADELIGMHVHHLMLIGSAPSQAETAAACGAGGPFKLSSPNLRLVTGWRKHGDAFPVELTISPVTLRDRNIYTAIIRDVTERTRLDRMKHEFVSVVSHELRTPLTSIQGSLALLNAGVTGELPPRARSMVSIGLQNSERLLRLINDILDMEKIESSKMEFAFEPLSVHGLIERAVTENRAFLDQYKLRIKVEHAAAADVEVRGDSGRLMQVLANLLSNAAKYSPEGGVITVGADAAEEAVRIWVKDEGPGIPDSFHERIFQKFSQADASDTRQKSGTGLGLSITKAIVERHGGTIGFKTADRAGTTFYFDLPIDREEATSGRKQRSARGAIGKNRPVGAI
ncbi:MAG: ATP-binding protein [Rhodomicrobiaceae bacterium]